MTTRAMRAAAAVYRRAVRRLRDQMPSDADTEAVALFDALQRDAHRTAGWMGLVRYWTAEAWTVLRLLGSPMHLRRDVRDAIRSLRRAPAYTTLVLLMLALGVGVNTAVFSVLDALLLKPLPYRDPERLVLVAEWPRTGGNWTAAPTIFQHWRTSATSFAHLEARFPQSYALLDGGDPEDVRGARVSAGYFDMLGITPVVGRTFGPTDSAVGAPCTAVISHRLWRARFGADRAAAGRAMRLSGQSCTLIGVLPPDTAFDRGAPELYTPLVFTPAEASSEGRQLTVIGRLRDGVSIEQARTEIETMTAAFNARRGPPGRSWTSLTTPWRDVLVRTDSRRLAWVLFGAVALVLTIACANVAGLSLARTVERRREIALRAALGAGRLRLFRALIVESVILAGVGGLIGILVGRLTLSALTTLAPASTFSAELAPALDGRAILFTALVALITGIAAGTLPAWQAGRLTLTTALAAGGRGASGSRESSRVQSVLLVVEVALAMVLVTGAALLTISFVRLHAVAPGFDPSRVMTVRVSAPASRYPTGAQQAEFFRRLLDALRRLPGVEHAGAATSLPLGGWLFGTRFVVDGVAQDPERPPSAHIQFTTPGYFEALRIELAGGRTIAATDTAAAPLVAVVNETFVRRFVPDGRAVGRRMWLDGATSGPAAEIIGVVRDVKTGGLADAALATPEIYVAHAQAPAPVMQVAIRTTFDDPQRIVPDLRATVRSVDPELPIGAPVPMDERIGMSLRTQRFRTFMMVAFASLAALLACLGVYAVRARAVALRTREFGIRLALGASRTQVLALTLRQGLVLSSIGLAIGLAAALFAARGIENWLFDTPATDPLTIAGATALLGIAAVAASYVPARRAASADPLTALRE